MCAGNNSSWIKVYSPASTNMPSAGSFEGHHNPMSPYPTPPNSHNSQGGSIAHYNTGVYDVGFNSPPDFTGPMSNMSDLSENGKHIAIIQRQQSGGISSPQGSPPLSLYHQVTTLLSSNQLTCNSAVLIDRH